MRAGPYSILQQVQEDSLTGIGEWDTIGLWQAPLTAGEFSLAQ